MNDQPDLLESAKAVLEMNNQGTYTTQSGPDYPHQLLWNSCFVAIGLRHYDLNRAKTEVLSLLAGQWHNGMVPNIIFSADPNYVRDSVVWNSSLSPDSPDGIATSGITQPPMLAEAIVKIGAKLKSSERKAWYKQTYPALLAYHEWFYAERDPHNSGLVVAVHPWETGLDNTPPCVQEMHDHHLTLWIKTIKNLRLGPVFKFLKIGTNHTPYGTKINIVDSLAMYSAQRQLRRKNYDIAKVLRKSLFSIEDLSFNCILVRANQHLTDIASYIKEAVPPELAEHMQKTQDGLDQLWDDYSGQYYSRSSATQGFLKQSTIATMFPLYASTISNNKAKQLVRLLENQYSFGTAFPVPSVPISSTWFDPNNYWQGPTWINANWLIIDGLKRMGFDDHAKVLTQSTLELVKKYGFYEHFNPINGEPAGDVNFSWTAALTIDLLHQN